MYAASGATDYYLETGDAAYRETLERLWRDLTQGKMYVTGGVGSRSDGEAIGEAYELPNAQAYGESCAAIGNMIWNWRMLMASGEGRFADMRRARVLQRRQFRHVARRHALLLPKPAGVERRRRSATERTTRRAARRIWSGCWRRCRGTPTARATAVCGCTCITARTWRGASRTEPASRSSSGTDTRGRTRWTSRFRRQPRRSSACSCASPRGRRRAPSRSMARRGRPPSAR